MLKMNEKLPVAVLVKAEARVPAAQVALELQRVIGELPRDECRRTSTSSRSSFVWD